MSSIVTCNIRVLKSPSGFLKLLELIVGVICLVVYLSSMGPITGAELARMILFLGNFPFLHTTFLLLLSMLISPMTANMLPKTVFEFIYHLLGCAFYLMTGLAVFGLSLKEYSDHPHATSAVLTGVLALINSVLYLLSTHFSFKSFKE